MSDPSRFLPQARDRSRSGTNVSVILSGLVAAALTTGFYLLVLPALPPAGLAVRLFGQGWVPRAVVLLSAWSAVILALKLVLLSLQRRALAKDLLPLQGKIDLPSLEGLLERLETLPGAVRRSLVYCRIVRALESFRSRGSSGAVANQLTLQGELDGVVVDSSYSMIKAFLWAIPMLGFVGTVLGIGEAVGSFSDSVAQTAGSLTPEAQLENLKSSLGGVTSGLGLAFDTTLIALVFSVLLMLPMNWLIKSEDDLLTGVSDYCNERLLMRIEEQPAPPPTAAQSPPATAQPSGLDPIEIRRFQNGLLEGQRRSEAAFLKAIDRTGSELAERQEGGLNRLTTLISERLGAVGSSLETGLAGQNAKLEFLVSGLTAEFERMREATDPNPIGNLTEAIERQAGGLNRLATLIAERLGALGGSIETGLAAQNAQLESLLSGLTAELERMRAASAASAASDQGPSGRTTEAISRLEQSVSTLGVELGRAQAQHQAQIESLAPEVAASLERIAAAARSLEAVQSKGVERVTGALESLARNVGVDLPALVSDQIAALDLSLSQFREMAELQKVQVDELREAVGSEPFRVYLSVLAKDLSRLGDLLEQMVPKSARSRYWFGRGRQTELDRKLEDGRGA